QKYLMLGACPGWVGDLPANRANPPCRDHSGRTRLTDSRWFPLFGRSLMILKWSLVWFGGVVLVVLAPALIAGGGARPPGDQREVRELRPRQAPLLVAPQPTPEQQKELQEAARLSTEAYDLYAKRQYAAAEKLLRQALAIVLKVQGELHPDTA